MSSICDICGKPYSSLEQYDPHECLSLREVVKERDRLRAALEAVEWVTNIGGSYCPWCGIAKTKGHASNCARQRALEVEG